MFLVMKEYVQSICIKIKIEQGKAPIFTMYSSTATHDYIFMFLCFRGVIFLIDSVNFPREIRDVAEYDYLLILT